MKEKQLGLAEQEALNQIRRWPTLYHSSADFFRQCVIGSQGSYFWKNGKLVSGEKRFTSKHRYVNYPFRISEEVAKSFLNQNHFGFPHIIVSNYGPAYNIPDNIHDDWIDFISVRLYCDAKITPDLYETLVKAQSIQWYGMLHNPNANLSHYQYGWNNYQKSIASIQARLRLVREQKQLGQIPPDRYMGIDI